MRPRPLAEAMDFRPLYRPDRHLFAIGFNLAQGRLDNACYDLLASECCLTSYLAVARGEAPRRHWFQLGRPFIRAAGRIGLISWGGTMFEYLMPRLLLRSLPGTLLAEACRTAVARQIEYGRELGLPWGISESGFSAQYLDGDYQYQAFGVPGLGLKRGLEQDRVIAPYATAMATMLAPARGPGELPPPRPGGRRGRIRLLRGDRLHPRAHAQGEAVGRRPVLHGPPPGDEPGGADQRPVRRRDDPAVPGRADGAGHRPAAPGAGPQRRADRRDPTADTGGAGLDRRAGRQAAAPARCAPPRR